MGIEVTRTTTVSVKIGDNYDYAYLVRECDSETVLLQNHDDEDAIAVVNLADLEAAIKALKGEEETKDDVAADYTIVNDGNDLDELYRKIDEVMRQMRGEV